VIDSLQHKLAELFRTKADETTESHWHRWGLDRVTSVYTALIVQKFPSGLIIQPPPTHLSIINEKFAEINQDMPDWIYRDMTPAMQAQ
jgi:hypothetical protein